MSRFDAGAGVTIRAMAEGDLDRVMEIAASLGTAPDWARTAYEAAIAGGDGPKRIALAAELSGEAIGFAVARVIAPLAEIETIAVAGKAQGRGYGSALLWAMLEELKAADAGEVELEVRSANAGALRLYQRAGFREVGRRRGYYREPDEDAVLLRLEFRASHE